MFHFNNFYCFGEDIMRILIFIGIMIILSGAFFCAFFVGNKKISLTVFIISIILTVVTVFYASFSYAADKENIHQIYNSRGNYQKDVAISIIHDDNRGVTCYLAQNPRGEEISISCLSDRDLNLGGGKHIPWDTGEVTFPNYYTCNNGRCETDNQELK